MKSLSKSKILSIIFTVLLMSVAVLCCFTIAGCKEKSEESKETALFVNSINLNDIINLAITVDEDENAVEKVEKVGFYLEKNVPSTFIYSEELTTSYDSILEENEQTSKTGMVKVYTNETNTEFAFASQYKIEAAESCVGLFRDFISLTEIDFSNFFTTNVTSMKRMFYNCKSLTSLNLSTFNTSNVTDMSHMFYSCKNLTEVLMYSFNTSNVTDMSYMFFNCSSLNYLFSIDMFNTSKVTDMSYMFYSCSNLATLNISNFDTRQIKILKFESMFRGTFSNHYYEANTKLILGENFKIGNFEINTDNLYDYTGLLKVVPFEIC